MVQETSTKSWGSRIISALWGILIGIVLVIGSFVLVFWNEGHGLHTAQSLQQAQEVLISIPNAPIDAKNNLHVVYFNGLATTEDVLHDSLFGLSEKAIELNRKVEMYQWKQNTETSTESQVGGSEKEVKTYTYQEVWSDEIIDSSEFKDPTGHQNPTEMAIKSKQVYAQNVKVGDFSLPHDLITEINGETPVDLSKIDLAALQNKIHKQIQANSDGLYVGADPSLPKTGDLRITVAEVLPQTVSIIAQQTENTLQSYDAPAGQSVSLLVLGKQSPQKMIADAQSANSVMMWVLRLVSLIGMIVGLALLMGPIVVLADVLPFLGSIASVGTGLIAFLGGLILWTVAIAIAWFVVRPILAIALVVIVIAVCYGIIKLMKRAHAG